ncbi:MAG: YeeE/YedE family protein [Hyphomicrobiales bacterium]|nr:YeeE/YedE family protein [Hyphomicrobiales bacterium]
MRVVIAFTSGILFGIGLTVSQMINPEKVLDFLDFAAVTRGGWDPSLALVMLGALIATFIGYKLTFRRRQPLLAPTFQVPTRQDIDVRLITGAALFGLGWGLVGFCPGPALAALSTGTAKPWLFVAAMAVGMGLYHFVFERRGA